MSCQEHLIQLLQYLFTEPVLALSLSTPLLAAYIVFLTWRLKRLERSQ